MGGEWAERDRQVGGSGIEYAREEGGSYLLFVGVDSLTTRGSGGGDEPHKLLRRGLVNTMEVRW